MGRLTSTEDDERADPENPEGTAPFMGRGSRASAPCRYTSTTAQWWLCFTEADMITINASQLAATRRGPRSRALNHFHA